MYVINTCSVTNMADRKSRQMIHRAKAESGCRHRGRRLLCADGGERQEEDETIDIVIGNNKNMNLPKDSKNFLKNMKRQEP